MQSIVGLNFIFIFSPVKPIKLIQIPDLNVNEPLLERSILKLNVF